MPAAPSDPVPVFRLTYRIRTDARHEHVTVVERERAPRTFGRWAMAEIVEDRPDRRLVSHAGSEELVTMGRDPSITPAQERVPAFMRRAATASV